MSTQNEKPIIMNAEMVKAILENRKTQTRRPVVRLPELKDDPFCAWTACFDKNGEGCFLQGADSDGNCFDVFPEDDVLLKCPFGHPGDRLWVKETYSEGGKGWIYKADGVDLSKALSLRWKSSIHCHRRASRITLEIVNVRVERVQEISKEDCQKEGLALLQGEIKSEYAVLWNSIYGKGQYAWDKNPWVWVIEFKNIKE